MAITSAAPDQEITSDLYNEIVNWINGVEDADTPASPAKFTVHSSTSVYSVTVGNQDTTNGLALKVQYGPIATPTDIATFAKAGVTFSVPISLTSFTSTDVTVKDQLFLTATDGTDTDNYFVRSAADTVDLYIGGIRSARFTTRGLQLGPVDQFPGTANTTAPYGAMEYVYPVDTNNAPKWWIPSAIVQEVVNDPAEINLRLGGNTTVGGAYAQINDSTTVGFLMWWARSNGSSFEKLAQIAVKTTQAPTTTAHGGGLALCTVPNSTVSEPRPRLHIGPDGRVLIDDSLASLDNGVWNTAYLTGIEERLAVRMQADGGMVLKRKGTSSIGNKSWLRFQQVNSDDAWSGGNGAGMIEVEATAVSPNLKTKVSIYSNIGASGPTIGLTVTDEAKVTIPLGLTVSAGTVSFPAGSVATAALAALTDTDPPTANQLTARSIVKAWGFFKSSAGTHTLQGTGYNLSGITDNGVGLLNVQFDLDFADANDVCVTGAANDGDIFSLGGDPAVGSIDVRLYTNAGALADSARWSLMAAGEQ